MKKLFSSMVVMASVACGGAGDVSGTIAGATLSVNDGLLWQQTSDGMTMGIVVLTDMSNACEKAQTNKVTKGASGLGITLAELTSDGKMIAPTVGEYNIVSGNGMPSGKFAGVTFFKNAADSCADSIAENQGSASSGKITVTKYDAATGAEGTFELNFSAGEKVTGSFNVASCAVTMASAEPTCE